MTRMTRRGALALLPLAAGVALTGCQRTNATSTGDMSPSDLEFVENAYNIINFDKEECTLAQTQAKDPEVKALATQLLQQALAFQEQLAPIAAASGISPPTVLRTDLRVRLGHMRLQQGLDFDQQFLEDQIASHEEALNREQSMMAPGANNPKLRALSEKGTELLTVNLAKLRAIQRRMMMHA